MASATDLSRRTWDVLVIGTGMGGSTLGSALVKAGKRVLFVEKGKSNLTGQAGLRGAYAETFFHRAEVPGPRHQSILSQAGRYWDTIVDVSGQRPRRYVPFVGSGTGGSTALYGMVLERFFEADFTPRRYFPGAGDSTLPETWPITYQDLRPYYDAAERLFRVRGSADPCRGKDQASFHSEPPRLSPAGQELADFFTDKGIHPYHLPLACEHVPDCRACVGFLCAKECKNDGARICLQPALTNDGAELLDECEALRIEATRNEVSGVVCRHDGREFTLRADLVVLAAGALESPRLLLRSASAEWPDGLANASGLVGRNLMRHYIDIYLISPKVRDPNSGMAKEIAFNDFYADGEEKLGTVQSFGSLPPTPTVLANMEQDIRDGPRPWLAPLFRLTKPLLRPIFTRMFTRGVALASLLEDLPYADNRVTLPAESATDGSRLVLEYRIRPHEQARIAAFRARLRELFKPYRVLVVKQAENNERLAHVCGTCRFGVDPATSVLDPSNRAHGLANLYLVDGSFFPSSAGTNPGLTIAANALRVADHILGRPPASLRAAALP
jgi:choline dehydrogenase-like flavoprotein